MAIFLFTEKGWFKPEGTLSGMFGSFVDLFQDWRDDSSLECY